MMVYESGRLGNRKMRNKEWKANLAYAWRKEWLTVGVVAAIGAGCLLRSEYEKEQLVIDRTVITSDKIAKECTIVFLSDLHSHEFGKGNRRLLAAVDEINPDVILIGGDMMVTCRPSSENGGKVNRAEVDLRVPVELLRRLTRRYPVYYGNGNHETRMVWERASYGKQYEAYVRILRSLGVVILDNRQELFRSDIAICGINLEERFYEKFHPDHLKREEITKLAGSADPERFQILLCHSPLFFDTCRGWGADLTLSGHFHGGTIRIPYLGGVMTPQFQFFLPWCGGTFEEDGKYMVVSRGLGTHSIKIRLNNKPSVVAVTLKKKE